MTKQERFIKTIAPLAQAEYTNRARWVLPSVCIAQAALESGWNIEAKTLFGIKGKGNNLKTLEYINGKYEAVTASFKAYPTIAAAVHGYYDLITGNARYSQAVNNSDAVAAALAIGRAGYATAPNYGATVAQIITGYNLKTYDYRLTADDPDIDAVARDVINGKYGNGSERRQRIAAAGYDYAKVQTRVNQILKGGK